MSHGERIPIESLLAHDNWVRKLALRLVRDESAADDLVQDTWLAAMRSPPRRAGPIRAWLGAVLRNRARQEHRGETRRTARETASALPDRSPPAGEIVSRADAHRHVVSSVLTLDEPYRTTVLLLFFDDLAPKEVAEQMGVPVDTVRTRSRRALDTLRARLDRDHGGERRVWAVALLGLDGWKRVAGTSAAVAGTGTAAGWLGTGVVMGMGTTIGAAAAGLAVGILLTLVAWGPQDPVDGAVGAVPVPGDEVTADRTESAAGEARGGADDDAAPVETNPAEAAPQPADDAEMALDLPPPSSGSIAGSVRFADGTPVAGVTIRGTVRQPRRANRPNEAGPPRRRTEAEMVADTRRFARWEAATTREVVTDANGEFVLTDLRDTEYELGAWAKGVELQPTPDRRKRSAKPGERFEYVAVAKIPVRFSVAGPGDSAPERVSIRWRQSGGRGGGGSAWWSADSPTVFMEPGTWEVTAEIRDLELATDEAVAVTVAVGTDLPPIELRLRGKPSIQGHLVLAPGQAWSRVGIYAAPATRGGMATDEALARGHRTSARAPKNEFRLDRIEPGTYTVAASVDGHLMYAKTNVVVGEARSDCTLQMPALGSDEVVSLRVYGPDGEPVTDVTFGLEIRKGTSLGSIGAGAAHAQADGSWLYPVWGVNQANWDGTGAEWTINVVSESLGTAKAPFVRGRDGRLEVHFQEPAELDVSVQGYVHATHAGKASVVLVEAGFDQPVPVIHTSRGTELPALDETGRQTFSRVAPGEYSVQLRVGGLRVATERVTVASGRSSVVVRMPQLVDVEVRAPDLEPEERIELVCARAPGNYYFSATQTLDDARTARWSGLPVGDYVLAGTVAGERREMVLRVVSAGTYDFVPGVLDGLVVSIEDANGKLAAAGFQSRDVIVRINGAGFETRYKARSLVTGAREKKEIDVVVLRGGRETTVRTPPTILSGFFDVGGSWVPVAR